MELLAETAQLAVLKGDSRNVAPGAGALKYKSPWGAGTLYVFVEGRGSDIQSACNLVMESIGREFKASNRSLTASLTLAIRAAHHELVAENRRSMPDQRITAGVTCTTVRGGDIYFAQAGPAVAYGLFGGRIMRFPAASSRALPSWSTPLGGDGTVQVTLAHHHLRPGDVVLMASSLLATKPVESELPTLLMQVPGDVLRHLERVFHDEAAFSALALAFEDPEKRAAEAAPVAPNGSFRKGQGNGGSPAGPILPSLSSIGSALARLKLPAVDVRRASKALRAFLPHGGPSRKDSAPAKRSASPIGNRRAAIATATRKAPERPALADPARVLDTPAQSDVEKKARRSGRVSTPSGGAMRSPRAAGGPKPNPSQQRRSRARNLRLPLFIMVILLAGLVVCSLTGLFDRLTDRQDEARFGRAMSSAAITRERALTAGDLARSRGLLNDADQLVSEALSINRSDPKARALKQSVLADLAKLNSVVRLPGAKLLTDLAKVEGGAKNLSNLVVEGEDIFILDRGTSRVYQFGVDLASGALKVGRNTLVAKKGDKVGETRIGDLVSILWMGQGPGRQSSNLLLFDSARNLFEFTPSKGMAQLKVRGASTWQNPALALGYNSNLYILDPSASQVWRYFPTFNGYDSEMRGLLENADIRDAVDFAIDGQIYVVTRGGSMSKFVGGRPESFSQDQLDKRLTNPTAILTSPKASFVYVLDAGNARIVVFNKEGKFQRQLVSEALEQNPRSLYVDEERGKIYILADNKLYLSDLPK